MEERVWQGDVTPDVVRTWGYDENLLLLGQDEDLLLCSFGFIPVLLELAGDDTCPKQDYAFGILCQFCRGQVTRGGSRGAADLREVWSGMPESAVGHPREWHQYVGRLLAYTRPSGSVDRPTARRMADDLLLGVAGRIGSVIEDTSGRSGWWRFTLRTSIIEHVDVCETAGTFSFTQSY